MPSDINDSGKEMKTPDQNVFKKRQILVSGMILILILTPFLVIGLIDTIKNYERMKFDSHYYQSWSDAQSTSYWGDKFQGRANEANSSLNSQQNKLYMFGVSLAIALVLLAYMILSYRKTRLQKEEK